MQDMNTGERLYHQMLLMRYFEERIATLFSAGHIHGTTHLYIGEEAVAAGVCAVLEPQDIIFSTHRGHGHCIGKGIDLGAMMAEFLGRDAGCCGGKGGSMHIADFNGGNFGTNGIVGGGIPLAVGAALSIKMQRQNRMVVCFLGDGATNQGTFHESLNLASVWQLPVLFVCEDNQYGFSMEKSVSMKVENIERRADSYGMPGVSTDGNDAFAVLEAAAKARDYVIRSGPMLLVCDTYRISGHSKSDPGEYRTKEEIVRWQKKDPIERMKKQLLEAAPECRGRLAAIEKDAMQAIDEAVAFAQMCPYPTAEAIYSDVYA